MTARVLVETEVRLDGPVQAKAWWGPCIVDRIRVELRYDFDTADWLTPRLTGHVADPASPGHSVVHHLDARAGLPPEVRDQCIRIAFDTLKNAWKDRPIP